MDPDHSLAQEIQAVRRRLEELRQPVRGAADRVALSPETVEGLSAAFEKLCGKIEAFGALYEELELDLRKARAGCERYQALFEFAPDGCVITDLLGVIQEANRAAATLLRVRAELLNRMPLLAFVAQESREDVRGLLARLQKGNLRSVRTRSMYLQPLEGARFAAALGVGPVRDARGQVASLRWEFTALTDIVITGGGQAEDARQQAETGLERQQVEERTAEMVRANEALQAALQERRRNEETLRISQAQFAAIIQSAMDAVITIDGEQRILLFNTAAERVFRCTTDQVVGQSIDTFIPERFRAAHREHVRAFSRSTRTIRRLGSLGNLIGLRATGEEFPMEAAISQVEVAGQTLFTVILRDITERRQAEEDLRASREQLRALAAHLEHVREDERTRIAREIHDELGQALTALRIELAQVAGYLAHQPSGQVTSVEGMISLVDATIRSIRQIATELRPGVLDDLGLVAAVEWQAHEFQNRTGIQSQFAAEPEDLRIDPDVATAVFRICQETLTNVARHANATQVTIRLQEEAGALVLTVADNGRGITEQEIAGRTSLGLLGMQERALLLGGRISIEGRRGDGTKVTLQIPRRPSQP